MRFAATFVVVVVAAAAVDVAAGAGDGAAGDGAAAVGVRVVVGAARLWCCYCFSGALPCCGSFSFRAFKQVGFWIVGKPIESRMHQVRSERPSPHHTSNTAET